MQAVAPVPAVNRPAEQFTHADHPGSEYLPTAHVPVQLVSDMAAVAPNVPALQLVQKPAPLVFAYVPAGHAVQLLMPADV